MSDTGPSNQQDVAGRAANMRHDQSDAVFSAKISAVVGELYYKQFFILLYLTVAYYLIVVVRDVVSAPADVAWLLHGSNALVLGFLAATWLLEKQGSINVTNIYLTPIPISLMMVVNVNLHIVLLDDPDSLPRGILLIMAFGIVSMFPWIFWLLVLLATAVHIIVSALILEGEAGQMIAVGVGAAMISYGGFAVRYNSIREQVRLNLLNQERAEKLAQLAKAKDEFIANMSHELRTPLTGLMGMVDLLDEAPLPKEERQYLATAKTSAETLRVIINDILDLSKLGAGKLRLVPSEFDIVQLARNVAEMMAVSANEKGIELKVDLPDKPVTGLVGDQARITQVLFNLLGNAVKFTDEGSVTLSLDQLDENDRTVTVRLSVEDTGVGIAPQDISRLFDRFEQVDSSSTRKQAGTGLGLSISQELVRLMDSRIELESEVGTGSRFWFEITLEKASERKADSPAPIGESDPDLRKAIMGRPLKLLVAEDNPVNQLLVKKLIGKCPWQADFVEDGEQAIWAADRSIYDLILMDIQMPNMNGEEAATTIRRESGPNANTPIVALTANCMPEDVERYLAKGINDTIAKPINLDTFYDTIARHLAQKDD